MKYEEFGVYEVDKLPKKTYSEWYQNNCGIGSPSGSQKYLKFFQQERMWYVFCPMDKDFKKYICHRMIEPPHQILESNQRNLEDMLYRLKSLKEMLD